MTVISPKSLLQRLRKQVPPHQRSAFIVDAVGEKLALQEQFAIIEETAGCWVTRIIQSCRRKKTLIAGSLGFVRLGRNLSSREKVVMAEKTRYFLDNGLLIRHLRGKPETVRLLRELGKRERLAIAAVSRPEVHAGIKPFPDGLP